MSLFTLNSDDRVNTAGGKRSLMEPPSVCLSHVCEEGRLGTGSLPDAEGPLLHGWSHQSISNAEMRFYFSMIHSQWPQRPMCFRWFILQSFKESSGALHDLLLCDNCIAVCYTLSYPVFAWGEKTRWKGQESRKVISISFSFFWQYECGLECLRMNKWLNVGINIFQYEWMSRWLT